MSIKSFEKGMTWGGLLLSSVAAVAFAMVSAASTAAPAAAVEGAEKHTQIRLVIDRDGTPEGVTLEDLHAMAVGESRTLTSDGGSTVVVTRDEEGFDVDLGGKHVRVLESFDGEPGGEGNVQFRKRVEILDGGEEGEAGEGHTMVFQSGSGEPGDVMIVKRMGGDGEGFSWTTGGGELPRLPFGVEATIERLSANPKFQSLDDATRAKVLEALRESAPQHMRIDRTGAGPGQKRVKMIVTEDGDTQP